MNIRDKEEIRQEIYDCGNEIGEAADAICRIIDQLRNNIKIDNTFPNQANLDQCKDDAYELRDIIWNNGDSL